MTKYKVGYSGRTKVNGEEICYVSSDFDAEVEDREHLKRLFDYVLSEIDGDIISMNLSIKERT